MAILRAQKPDGTYGDVKMDAKGRILVHNGLEGPQTLLDYPRVGSPTTHLPGINDEALFYKGSGESGKVRSVWIDSPTSLNPTSELRIYVDAGEISDLTDPPAASLAARIPIQTLLGMRLDSAMPNIMDTAILVCAQHPIVAGHPTFELTLPIPYADGCLIQIWQNGAPYHVNLGDLVRVEFEEGPLPAWQYAGWRLRSGVFDGTVTWDGTEPYGSESEAQFLDAPSGPGMLVSLHAAMKSLATEPNWGYCLNPWELSMDSLSGDWRTLRTEDMFGGCGQYFQVGIVDTFRGYTWGLFTLDYEAAEWEAYSLLTRAPIVWSDGCAGFWRNRLEPGDVEAHILALYYAP